jgi:ABC-type branched-subunit amino acid transport system ATPase component
VPAAELSHGERRQLEIAMALALGPARFLLDEPMAGMGPEGSRALTGFLDALRAEAPILLVEHDMDAVFALADRISVLVYGRIIATGTVAEIRANREVRGLSGRGRMSLLSRSRSGLEAFYGPARRCSASTCDVGEGEVVALMGRNGMGKTTTIRSICGLTPPRAGTHPLRGRDIAGLPPFRVARLGIGLVPEGGAAFPT